MTFHKLNDDEVIRAGDIPDHIVTVEEGISPHTADFLSGHCSDPLLRLNEPITDDNDCTACISTGQLSIGYK